MIRAVVALLALSLGGCVLLDPQPEPDPGCADPTSCDPPDSPTQPLRFGGTVTVTQTVTSAEGACEVDPTNPIVLTVTDFQTVEVDAPNELRDGYVEFDVDDQTTVGADVDEQWGETWYVSYDLTAHASHEVFGEAHASSPGCSAVLHVEGTWSE